MRVPDRTIAKYAPRKQQQNKTSSAFLQLVRLLHMPYMGLLAGF